MDEDKKIRTDDLPHGWQRNTTQQPEEYIDKESVRKDENDTPQPPADDARDHKHERGSQESA